MPNPMCTVRNRLLPSFALILFIGSARAHGGLESGLKPGPYKVGFQQRWHFDYGRSYQTRMKDTPAYATSKAARPILMNLWYPAVSSTVKRMPHSKYLDFAKGSRQLTPWFKAFQTYNRGIVCGEVMRVAERALKPAQRQVWQQYLNTPTACILDAKWAKGKFPVVVYHQGYGSSVDDNNELCEYLASFGYVVVNSSYLAADGESFNIDSRIGSHGDINFLAAYLRTLPNVDWTKVGFVGHSGGAHTGLKYRAMQNGVIDAIVSLDTTQDYYGLQDPRWKFIKTDILPSIDQMDGPIMMVANPYAIFELADKFINADRVYFTVPLDHNEFISQGVQALRVASALAPPAKRTETRQNLAKISKRYERLCEFVRLYFEDELRGRSKEFDLATRTYAGTREGGDLPHVELQPKGLVKVSQFDTRSGVAPTPRQVRPFLAKEGAAKTSEVIRDAYGKDKSAPIYEQVFAYSLVFDLFKGNRAEDAKTIYTTYRDLGVKPAGMFISQAWFGDMSKNYAFAEECLNMLLSLEPDHAEGKKMLEDIRKKMSK